MQHDADAFRARYRADIHPLYNATLHAGFVLSVGIAGLAFFCAQLQAVQPLEWLVVPAALVLFNWGEYTVHKRYGHNKHAGPGALFYKRHTGDHHSFFVTERMRYDSAKDWRVILFPAWLIILYSAGAFAAWWVIALVNANVAALFSATMLFGYLVYEIFHSCEHLPDESRLAKLPWIRQMRRHHALHHRRDLMQTHNFNLVFPLMDWLCGTLYREPQAAAAAHEEKRA